MTYEDDYAFTRQPWANPCEFPNDSQLHLTLVKSADRLGTSSSSSLRSGPTAPTGKKALGQPKQRTPRGSDPSPNGTGRDQGPLKYFERNHLKKAGRTSSQLNLGNSIPPDNAALQQRGIEVGARAQTPPIKPQGMAGLK